MEILNNLNPPQTRAVTEGDGPLLVLAGAGSGKTKVLTSRIAYLIQEKQVPAYRILAITFTNKAALEMRRRVETMLPEEAAKGLWVFTFHGACLRILRRQEEIFGRNRDFVIYDADDQLTLVKECLKEMNLDDQAFKPRKVLWSISQAKNQLCDEGEFTRQAYDRNTKKIAEAYHLYARKLMINNAVDFDDMIMLTVRLFKENPAVLDYWRERFRYVLVDEYQDTNHAQYVLVHLLASGHRNLFVVGDPDQGIYGWRGADLNNIMSYERDYPDARVITLEQNYRSTNVILESANEIIRKNPRRQEKKLWSAVGEGEPLQICCASDERDEADYVAGQILYRKKMEDRAFRDFAVFFRTHAQSRVLEEVFVRSGIPYAIVGGVGFYNRKEIRDVLAYLKIIHNPDDAVALNRIINVPRRGIGPVSYAKIIAYARGSGFSPMEALYRIAEIPGIAAKPRQQGQILGELILLLSKRAGQMSLTELVEAVLDGTDYRQELILENTVEARTRLENLAELLTATSEYDQREESPSLAGFLEEAALVNQAEMTGDEADLVRLMTLHSAKGLEFPVVFISGMEEGVFPHARSMLEDSELEEERRLCYVGITRAMERLYLTRCRRRSLYGSTNYNQASRFLGEIPAHLLEATELY